MKHRREKAKFKRTFGEDRRPDFADPSNPDMPITGKDGSPVHPDAMVQRSQRWLDTLPQPNWRDDPTYNLAPKKGQK